MKKNYSLKRNEEIAKIVHLRKMVKNECFTIYYLNNIENKHARFCISVSKKLGHAVVRNKVKRQVREMITDIFDFSPKFDYVVVIKTNYLEKDFKENKELLEKLYLKLNSINKECK